MKMDITGESKGSPAKSGGYSALTKGETFVILNKIPDETIFSEGECTMQAKQNWLADPAVFQVNRLDAHSDHICYASAQEAAAGVSSLRQSLDGQWLFRWSPNADACPADFWQEEYDLGQFGTIQVPGHMETQGFGQIHYTNKLYPWDGHTRLLPPEVDWQNSPVGCYVRLFDLAPGLLDKQVCVSFQGIEQAAFVWLNGHFVGYCEDTFTPSDFDLTPYIRPTGNRLCVQVHKRSTAAWLEDQDFFRFSGIFRSVFLYGKPRSHIQDLWIRTSFDPDAGSGAMDFRLVTEGMASVRAKVSHPQDGTLFEGGLELIRDGNYVNSQTLSFPMVRRWDYGSPELYRVELWVYDEEGGLTEYIPYDTGFRRMEIRDKVLTLNGRRLMLNGVNRHEWNPDRGRAVTDEDMDAAMAMFKANRINAVRTSHYPNQSRWYDLCDRAGIYVMDETNMETHGTWQKDMAVDPTWNVPGSLPEWKDCVLDRARSMFERDKNHVSILFWSCGNESYAGADILAMADFFRGADPSRVVHYEGVFHCREFDAISDVESRMYATPAEIREYLETDGGKPYLNCEYMHNMGNSLGGMESYVRLGEEFPQYHGGFIWDYMDQALFYTDVNGRKVLGYGGDFGDRQSDYNFSGNGIVTADGEEKPCMQEVRYWYAAPRERAEHDQANRDARNAMEMPAHKTSRTPLVITQGDGAWGVKGEGFEILFSISQAGPCSLRWGSTEWMWRGPRPAYWRAPTENDIGCGFPLRSAVWSAADQHQTCTERTVLENGDDCFAIRYRFTAPVLPDLRTDVTYRVDRSGNLDVEVHYFGAPGRPELPLLGLRFATPRPVTRTEWMGLSGETYPDRYKGAVYGLHSEVPHIANYLVPQECGNHQDTDFVRFHMDNARLYLEKRDAPFAFSAIPYTPAQLEQAFHREELPLPTRTVITVCGKMRGVGGIDSWGSDVEPACRVSAGEDIVLNFRIRGE